MPHLQSFRRDKHGLHFRIRRDHDYWDAIRELNKGFPSKVRFTAGANEFTVPNTSRVKARLAAIFPKDWAIIQDTNTHAIIFAAEDDKARENQDDW